METTHAMKKFFAVAAGGVLLTAALGLEPGNANAAKPDAAPQQTTLTVAQQSAEIAAFFEKVNREQMPIADKSGRDREDIPLEGIHQRFDMLEKNKDLITDRVFRAWEQMTRHWNARIKYTAVRSINIFNSAKMEYVRSLLHNRASEWALSTDHDIRWAAQNTIWHVAQHYPDLVGNAVDIAKKQMRSHDSEVRESGVNNAEIISQHRVSHRPHMLWMLEETKDDSSVRVRWVALYVLEKQLKASKPGELEEYLMENLFNMAAKEQAPGNMRLALDVAQAAARHAPEKLLRSLMDMALKTLATNPESDDEYDRHTIARRALWIVADAGNSSPALFDEAYETIVPYLKQENRGLVGTAMGALADMSVHTGKRTQQSYDLILPFLQSEDKDRRFATIKTLAILGEKHEEFAKIPFDEAKTRIYQGNPRYVRAQATGILGAIGAAHKAFRAEAFTLVKSVAITRREDGTVHEVAVKELAAIAAADDKYADKVFAWAKGSDAKEYESHVASKVAALTGLANCDWLEEAKGILREHFEETLKISDVETCRARLRDNPKETNLPSGLIFSADDHSFE